MTIKYIQIGQAGLSPNLPSWVYLETNDTLAKVTTTGYLSGAANEYINSFRQNMMALVSTKTSPGAGVAPVLYTLQVIKSNGVWSLQAPATDVPVPFIVLGNIQAGANGTAGQFISYPATLNKGFVVFKATDNSGNNQLTITNASVMGQSSVITVPDPGATTANFILSKSSGTQHITAGSLEVDAGNITAGISGTNGKFVSFPSGASNGTLNLSAVNAGGAWVSTISNSIMGQSTVFSMPDPGAATANFLLDTGTGATATITKISTGATPVPLVDPGSCTITAAAGASNTATVTIQLKDGAGTNIARSVAFRVYASSAADGLTLAGAASTGFSVASGGLSLQNGAAITTQISAMSSASGACVLSLLDTGKQTSYLVLVLPSGNKISAQLSAGSYGA